MNVTLSLRAINLLVAEEWSQLRNCAREESRRRDYGFSLLSIIEEMAREGDPEALRFVEAFVAQELLR